MKNIENTSLYKAEDGKTIARKGDGFVMGTCIDLGDTDSIDNYEEIPLTEENDVEGILKKAKAKRK